MTKETYNRLLECETIDAVETILEPLKDGFGGDYRFVDEKIDDGDDGDGEDEYVMMRSYDFFIDGEEEERYTKFYYGNNTRHIGYVA